MKISTIIAEAQEERIFREYLEMYEIVRSRTVKLSTLTEAKIEKLGTTELHNIFFNIEKAMTAGNQNKNLLGKGADLLGKAGAGIGKIGQAAADSAIGKGLDKVYRDAKQKITTAMGKTETGAKVLRKIDHYKQLAKKYPHLNDAVTKATSILAGAASGGATGVAIGAAIKAADAAVKGGELTDVAGSAIKGGALAAAGAAAVKAPGAIGNLVDQGVDAYNNLDLNPFDNDVPQVDPSVVDPNAPPVSDVYPDEADRGVKPGADTPAPGPENVNPPPKPVPPKPVPVKPVPAPAPTPDVTAGAEVPNVNSTAYLDAAKQNIISQNMAAQNAGVPGADMMAQDTVTQPVAPRNIAEAFRALDFKVVALPLSIMVDKESTVRRWALNESLGRPRGRGVQLTEDGVNTVFYNVDKFYRKLEEAANDRPESQTPEAEAKRQARAQARDGNPVATDGRAPGEVYTNALSGRTAADLQRDQQGGTVYNRPANANDPAAMAKNARTSATNTSTTAGPLGGLPGGNVGGLATGTAPAGNKMPYLAADPEGKFKTTYSGEVGNEFLTKAERGLGRFKGYMGDLFKSASTKFDANQAKARFASSGSATDSDSVAQWLTTQKVPADVITQVYQQLKLPAPNLQAAGAAKDQGVNRHSFTRGIGGGVDTSNLQEPDQVGVADADATAGAKGAKGAKGQKTGAVATGTDASAIAQQSGAAPQQQKVAREIDAEIDDLIRALRKTDNILQPAYVKYIRDALDKTFGPATAAAPAAAPAAPAEVPTASSGGTGGGIAPVTTSAPAAVPKTGTNNEGRRAKGRYIKETRAQKLARQFEAYVMGQA
jgi:hypothetical protein